MSEIGVADLAIKDEVSLEVVENYPPKDIEQGDVVEGTVLSMKYPGRTAPRSGREERERDPTVVRLRRGESPAPRQRNVDSFFLIDLARDSRTWCFRSPPESSDVGPYDSFFIDKLFEVDIVDVDPEEGFWDARTG